jgi:hypothetical protein
MCCAIFFVPPIKPLTCSGSSQTPINLFAEPNHTQEVKCTWLVYIFLFQEFGLLNDARSSADLCMFARLLLGIKLLLLTLKKDIKKGGRKSTLIMLRYP